VVVLACTAQPLQKGLDNNSWCDRNTSINSVCEYNSSYSEKRLPQQTHCAKGGDPQVD